MIRHLNIKNFATIENISVDFDDGLNIITGETGAGKSVLIEAVSLALGSRADTSFIRSGQNKALVQMIADYEGEEYIITREISSNGKNTCRINDEIVTLSRLNSFCSRLADIHGQYDHQSLLDPEQHIKLVDLYHKDETNTAKKKVSSIYKEYITLKSRLDELITQQDTKSRQYDFMSYELNELREASLQSGEDTRLEKEISLLQNSEKIYENLSEAYHSATESEFSALSSLKHIDNMLSEISGYSQDLSELSSRISDIYYELEDVCTSVRTARDGAVFSPQQLDSCIARMETINRLKTKHRKSIEELIQYQDYLQHQLTDIEDFDIIREQLKTSVEKSRQELSSACLKLSDIRKKSAAVLEKKITSQLSELNFNDAVFKIEFKFSDTFTPNGTDIIEFMISTNKGSPLKPLSKIASGGEMSRIMLAFKTITGDYDGIPTMIFDEIDSGISGITASITGRKLAEISKKHQIICITHLPQIAAYGLHNYRIAKASDDSTTYTTVTRLSEKEKISEIARLLGGVNVTDITLQSAKELIDSSLDL